MTERSTGVPRGSSVSGCLLLLGLLLVGCASAPATGRREAGAPGGEYSWEEARADPSCVVPRCDEEGCALWRCGDLVEVVEGPGVVLARGPAVLRPPLVVGNPRRWRGRSIAAPSNAEPVFEIPWRHWKASGQPVPVMPSISCLVPPSEPIEKHHVFPQEESLARWFKVQGIDIHAFTIPLAKSFHAWLHSGGPKGGQWNEAWRQFRDKNRKADAEEIWRFAFELMARFGVNGPFVSYYCE
jgi:uncharacterized lipoprotein (TIGR02269 family)